MSAETIRRIEHCHALYCNFTGREVPLNSGREHQWLELIKAIADMDVAPERAVVLVAQRVKRLVGERKLWDSALDFRRFVGDTDTFTEHLAAALAESRKPKVNRGLAEVLVATGRSAEPKQPEPRKIDEVLESAARKAFLDLRKSL